MKRSAASAAPICAAGLLAHQIEGVTGPGDGIEMEPIRVVGAILHGRPVQATILGAQYQVEDPDHVAHLVVLKPDVEQGFVGPSSTRRRPSSVRAAHCSLSGSARARAE